MNNFHNRGPMTDDCCSPQFSKLKLSKFSLTCKIVNKCCKIGQDIVLIKNFATFPNGEPAVIGKKFLDIDNFFINPCVSSELEIYKVKKLSNLRS